ncbi:MAG: glycosyltransferase family 8 protein [Limnochordia bacterium]|mgnify:CR=1 FL=1|nr:glycosyltransferase family 8 protein [Bacillota bacterium]HOB08755.1 glycosyltransferase family 8 protein [Limnochordia bacterium]HPT92790.1 glycosyltransferase family 8 protein [Limnochordia bacterium]HPZ30781.1 glycosyltransferase family 8 protein [Limnochordia bacterium]HQD71272.1 glycosyltransferase family 8 protein [Limnochordia bacterium]
MTPINILATIDANYLVPLKVMLKSMFINNPEERFRVYLMHSRLDPGHVEDMSGFAERNGHLLVEVKIGDDCFSDAPVVKHYTKEMYYRLLAFRHLPQDLDRILYLDPDILVINPIRGLYETDLSGWLFAAAYHDIIFAREINRLRFREYNIKAYYNSGVLLMNLELIRTRVDEEEIYGFVRRHKNTLILPDQDILNSLYSQEIRKLDEFIYNYDVRYYRYRPIISKRRVTMDSIINDTVILHFCGKRKPWHTNYNGAFHSLYKHYQKLALADR